MAAETHPQLVTFIWSICNLLRSPYKRNEYRKVILPLTVLRRFDCLLGPTKAKVLQDHAAISAKPESVVRSLLQKITGRPFFNLSKLTFTMNGNEPEKTLVVSKVFDNADFGFNKITVERPLEAIEVDMKMLEGEIMALLAEVTA